MPLLLSLLGNKWIWVALALAGLSVAVWVQTERLEAAQGRVEALKTAFEGFKAQIAAEGEKAQKNVNVTLERHNRTVKEAKGKYATDIIALHHYYQSNGLSGDNPGGRTLSPSDSHPVRTDGASGKLGFIATNSATNFTERCAQDALTLYHLQEHLRANGHPTQ